QAAEGVCAGNRQIPVEAPVELAHRSGAVDDPVAVVEPTYQALAVAVLDGEFAHDLLENVVERDQALDVAVLVDYQAQALFAALEFEQLLGQSGALGHEIGR